MQRRVEAPWSRVHSELGVIAPDLDDRSLAQHVYGYSRRSEDLIALQYRDRNISYAELDDWSNRLAHAFLAAGIEKGDVVGIHLPNIPQYVVALVAVSRIGCAATGLSHLLSPSEFAYQVQDAGVKILLTLDEYVQPVLEALPGRPDCLKNVIVTGVDDHLLNRDILDKDLVGSFQNYLQQLSGETPRHLLNEVQADDLFMLLYTGGTTGRPKGAMLTVRNMLYNVLMSQVYNPWVEGEEVLATAFPLFHAAGMTMTITALTRGASVTLIPDPRDIEHFCEQMMARPPTRLAAVPTLYQMLLDCPASADVDFTALKTAVSGAAPLTAALRSRIGDLIGENKLGDVYGMTETGPLHVTNPPGRIKPDSVGIPLPGADTRIVDVDSGLEEMKAGETGEIITSGPQVMKGYFNLPEETTHALRDFRGETYMYTGDIGYMDDEGYIFLCDRAKDMLIVGGFKVFSVELEDKLADLECIDIAVIVGVPDSIRPGNDIVTLFVKPAEKYANATQESLWDLILPYCQEHMSAYKCPRVMHLVNQVPLTSVGKIDKKVLRALAGDLAAS